MTTANGWSRSYLSSLVGSLLLLAGCTQVRLIREGPEGGVVSIPNNSNQWPTYYRNRAETLMHQKCPAGYVIEREQVVEDNPTTRDGRKPNEDFEYNGAYQRISHDRRQEYHIAFHKARPSVPAPKTGPVPLPAAPAASPAPADDRDDPEQQLPPPRRLPAAKGEG